MLLDSGCETITSRADLERLRAEWSVLWSRCPSATPFQSPEWLLPWWRHFGEGRLRTLAVREKERLVGLAPLYVYTQPDSGRRNLFLLGIGTSDYLDVLFEGGCEQRVAEAIREHLKTRAGEWDTCDFQQLRPGSPLLSFVAPSPWSDETARDEDCPVLRLDGQSVPPRMWKNVRYYRRRAERLGEVSIEAVRFSSASRENPLLNPPPRSEGEEESRPTPSAEELFDCLIRLHGARWATRGLPGVLSDERVDAAHRDALPGLLAAGLLRLYGLWIGDQIVACLYALADARRHYYYISGFDPRFAEVSPGTLLLGHAIEQAAKEGATEFDFLRGREPYKYLWGAQDRPTFRRVLRRG